MSLTDSQYPTGIQAESQDAMYEAGGRRVDYSTILMKP